MPQKILLIILASSLFSCATLSPSAPKAPSVELGVIDYPNGEVIVNQTGKSSFQWIKSVPAASYNNVVKAIVSSGNRVPLASYDRAISFKPAQWTLVQLYINSLTNFIRNHCNP